MTALAEQVQRARAERPPADVKRALLTLLFVVPFVLGWLAGMLFAAASWAWTATVVGWRTAQQQAAGRGVGTVERR